VVGDALTARDRQLVVDLVLEDVGELRAAILAEPTRVAAVDRVRRALGQILIATASMAGEGIAVQGLGSRVGLRVTVGDRQGLVRWHEVADAVRHLQLALFSL
jgi:hypothetical protein